MRPNGRGLSELRPLTFERSYTSNASGSVLVRSGKTWVLCTCCVEPAVPEFLEGTGKGWLTAEYSMLPGSTGKRKPGDKAGKVDGRSVEIQRLIGRSLRAIVDLDRLGERTLWIDCDVLQADGGTRTAAINGAFVALVDGLMSVESKLPVPPRELIKSGVAAISVGIVDGEERLDLEYVEDRDAEVDMNLVMTSAGEFIEVQGSGEEATFRQDQLDRLLALGKLGIAEIAVAQKKSLGERWLGNDPMRTVDLHGLTSKDAIARFVDVYNHAVRHGQRERISVVHGYGASGKGGTLRGKMRAFLDRNHVEYLCGELVDGNPGHTIVIPGSSIQR